MANKKNEPTEKVNAETPLIDELSQLRTIVFGASEHKLNEQITQLRGDMEQSISFLDQRLAKQLANLQQNLEHKINEIDKRITEIDIAHDDKEAVIQKSVDNLYSEHEILVSTTQQDFQEINQSLGNESQNLTINFDQQLQELKVHLEKVSTELSSSKTDRKTLAKLLATMATNLEDDEL